MIHKTQIRVRYAETDQMSYVYYGNYAQYFEVARVEFLRSQGYSYKDLEEDGVMMPVVEMNIQYKRPARYDDLLTIKTQIADLNERRILFHQEVFNDANKLLTIGQVELAFISAVDMRPIKCPEHLKETLLKLTHA